MLFACVLLLFLEYSCGFPRTVNKVLTVSNGATWGTWRSAEFCPSGAFANGISFKIEGKQGRGDDTALNAVKLHCGFEYRTDFGGDITSGVADWGVWTAKYYCPRHNGMSKFLNSFLMKVEANQGRNRDDTAANYAKFKCRDFDGTSTENTIPSQFGDLWGRYGSWSGSCPKLSSVCGIQTRVERSLGGRRDDTALNDVKLFCCSE